MRSRRDGGSAVSERQELSVSRPTRGAWTVAIAVAVGLLIVSGCGTSDDDEEPIVESDSLPAEVSEDAVPSEDRGSALDDVEHWVYMIDVNLDADVVDEIVESEHDLVVLDFIPSEEQNTDYPMGEVVDRLHQADRPKLVLAYIDIGQAEDYRVYWEEDWQIGNPDWIVANDPDGWEGNFPVAYWRQEWQAIWLAEDGLISQIVAAGFDGVYLDWIEAYSDDNVVTAADRDSVDPFDEMADWVIALAETGRDRNPDFLVVAQNAAELAAENDEYRAVIDALAQEQVWFDGAADNDPPGDCPLPSTDELIDTEEYEASLSEGCLQQYLDFPDSTLHVSSEEYLISLDAVSGTGLPILTVDYAADPANVQFVLEASRDRGFIPFVGTRLLNEYVPPR
jgi:cysteinyl-tRNA synthetase